MLSDTLDVTTGAACMTPYWLSFTDGTYGCCEGEKLTDAITRAEDITGKVVSNGKCIPYPAVPVLWQSDNCPAFCYNPNRCAGKSSCPSDPACTE